MSYMCCFDSFTFFLFLLNRIPPNLHLLPPLFPPRRSSDLVPQQLPQVAAQLQKAGLEVPPEQLADLTGQPMGAVVSLGGCTASFVSPQGLEIGRAHV